VRDRRQRQNPEGSAASPTRAVEAPLNYPVVAQIINLEAATAPGSRFRSHPRPGPTG